MHIYFFQISKKKSKKNQYNTEKRLFFSPAYRQAGSP